MSGKRYRVEWAEVARRDLEGIIDYVFSGNPTAALRIAERVERRARNLASMPDRGRIPPELIRFRVEIYRELQIPPYRLIYRVYESGVVVLGVFDGRRDLEDIILGRLLSL